MTSTPSTEEKPRKRSPRVCASKPIDYDDKKHLLSSPLKRERPHHDDTVVVEGGLTELEQRMDDHANRWETDSMFEDIIEDLTEDKFFTDGTYHYRVSPRRHRLSCGARQSILRQRTYLLSTSRLYLQPLSSPTLLSTISLHISTCSSHSSKPSLRNTKR
jgi:hypothetical protein